MEHTSILDRTKRLLEEAPLSGENIDMKVLFLLRSEYLHHLGRYRRIDLLMQKKYGITFDEFNSQRIVQKKKYSWDVESDAMEWETAVSGINTMEKKIAELRQEGCV